MKNPFRFWMTGSVAVVMAALGMGRSAIANERQWMSQSSRYRVTETVERIAACAQRHGLSVFTCVVPDTQPFGEDDETTLIVFESADGGTPVLMEGPQSQPEVPLAVAVRADPTGGAEVLFGASDWADLPPTVAREMTELPIMVADALR
jgi:uncharacterized protein (DUF302 family)